MINPNVSVRWGGFTNNICYGFAGLQQQAEFVDMTLAADSHHVKVHQTVVALASPYLKELIKFIPNKHPVIFLTGVTCDELCYILEYIYTGEVDVPKDKLDGFIKSAKALHIIGIESPSTQELNEMETTEIRNQVQNNIVLQKPTQKQSQYTINISLDNVTPSRNQNESVPVVNETTNTNQTEVCPSSSTTRPENTFSSSKSLLDCLKGFENHQMDTEDTTVECISKDSPLDLDKLLQVQGSKDFTNTQYSRPLTTDEMMTTDEGNQTEKPVVENDWNAQGSLQTICIDLLQQTTEEHSQTTEEHSLLPVTVSNVNPELQENVVNYEIKSGFAISTNSDCSNIETAIPVNTLSDDDIIGSCAVQYTLSNKGALQLLLNRFIYYVHNMASGNKRRWRCIDYRSKKCTAVVDTEGEMIVQRSRDHTTKTRFHQLKITNDNHLNRRLTINDHTHPFHDKKILEKVNQKLVFTTLAAAEHGAKNF